MGKYPIGYYNTDTLGIPETTNTTKNCNQYHIHNYINSLNIT